MEQNDIFRQDPAAEENVRRVNVYEAIRSAAKIAGLALIAMFAMQWIAMLIVEIAVTPVFGSVDPETGVKYLDDTSAVYYIVYFCQYFAMFIPPILIAAFCSGKKGLFRLFRPRPGEVSRFDTAAFEKFEADIAEHKKLRRRMIPEVLMFAPIMIAAAYVMGIAANFIEIAFNMIGLVSPEIFASDPVTPTGWVFYILTLCVAAPVCEELFFRGAVMNLLKPFGAGFAITCQAILFSVFHGTVAQLPYTVVGGLLLGYVAHRYGGILPAIIIHALNNGISVLVSSGIPDSIWNDSRLSLIVSAAVYIVAIIGAFLLLKVLAKSDKKLFKSDDDSVADRLPGLSAFRTFLAHPAMIGYFCIQIGMMLFTMLLNSINLLLSGAGLL